MIARVFFWHDVRNEPWQREKGKTKAWRVRDVFLVAM